MLRIVASIGVLLSSFSASFQPAPSDMTDAEWTETAAFWLIEEVDVLAEADAFQPNPFVEAIDAAIEIDVEDREDLLETINDFDLDGVSLLEAADARGRQLSPQVRNALGRIPLGVRQRIIDGDVGFIEPGLWLDAIADLVLRGGLGPQGPRGGSEHKAAVLFVEMINNGIEPSPDAIRSVLAGGVSIDELRNDVPALDSPTTTQAIAPPTTIAQTPPTTVNVGSPDTTPSASTTPTSSAVQSPLVDGAPAVDFEVDGPSGEASGLPVVVIASVGGGLLALVLALIVMRRSRRKAGVRDADGLDRHRLEAPESVGGPVGGQAQPANDPDARLERDIALTDLLDMSRRMTAALDTSGVAAIAVTEAIRLAGAEAGGYVAAGDEQLELLEPSHHGFFSSTFVGGAIGRVVETGQPMCSVTSDDPALIRLPVAVAATPVIAGGEVGGAIVVLRSSAQPFSRRELDALGLLAPVTGSAMAAARTHLSAVSRADVDGLTHLHNRRRLDSDLADLAGDAAVGFAMIDVDHFKNFNDTNGHPAGDEALRQVARCIAENLRDGDTVYRYGGEEFSVVLRGADVGEARDVMERVRRAVEMCEIDGGENQPEGRVTISVGMVVAIPDADDASSLTEAADAALYEAKRAGRNQVVLAGASA